MHKSIFISLDESRFSQVMSNLIKNAFKFLRKGGLITVPVTLLEGKSRGRLSVMDTGVGNGPVKIFINLSVMM